MAIVSWSDHRSVCQIGKAVLCTVHAVRVAVCVRTSVVFQALPSILQAVCFALDIGAAQWLWRPAEGCAG